MTLYIYDLSSLPQVHSMSSYLNYTPIFIKVNTILQETLKMSMLPISMTILLDFLTYF